MASHKKVKSRGPSSHKQSTCIEGEEEQVKFRDHCGPRVLFGSVVDKRVRRSLHVQGSVDRCEVSEMTSFVPLQLGVLLIYNDK